MLKYFLKTFFLFSLIKPLTLFAQESVHTAGGNVQNAEANISYSIGQIAYKLHSGETGNLAEGVQQPYEISIVSNVSSPISDLIDLKVFPNPTAGLLQLNIHNEFTSGISYKLMDLHGRLLKADSVESETHIIQISNFPEATYFLQVFIHSQAIKTFKIIKK